MATARVFQFFNVRPGATVAVFIYGYANNDAVNYSLVVHPQLLEGVAGGGVTISGVKTYRHVDGSAAHTVVIENPTSGWQDIDVLDTVESY